MTIEVFYVIVAIFVSGLSTVFLRLALLENGANEVRFIRALTQTLVIVVVFFMLGPTSSLKISSGMLFPLLDGLLGGLAFIAFCKGLKFTEAGRAKPIIALNLVIPVALGILILNEGLSISKVLGVSFTAIAVYLLSSDRAN